MDAVARTAEGASDRMVHEYSAGRTDLAHDVERRPDNQRGDLCVFDDMRDETDGLVAEGSIGD